MKNYSDLIKSKERRTLTAKGVKFVWRCIDIAADQRNLNRYSPQLKAVKDKLYTILEHLIIDKEMSVDQIRQIVKERTVSDQNIPNLK